MYTSQKPEKSMRTGCEFARIESEALKGFHEAEARQLQDLLTRVYENMIDIQKEEGTDK